VLKRAICPRCLRPTRACICQWITPTPNIAELVILQHPLEVNNAKNTAGLLRLSLASCQLHIGETFEPEMLRKLLAENNKTNVLLFPATPEMAALDVLAPPEPPDLGLVSPSNLRLILLDGTWRKSRKMLYLNPLLQQLPRYSLTNCPESLYHIRKAEGENQLSSLEASCYALQQLDAKHVDYQPLLAAFKEFVAQRLAFVN
jgi:DTW domain-containing protein YfiP